MARPHRILVAAIRIDGGTQSRVQISDETVNDYAEAMREGAKFPAIRVVFDGTDYWLSDGFHRVLAMQRLNKADCDAIIAKGTKDDAVWLACAANRENGLRRTNSDKRKAVQMAIALRPDESDHAIAVHTGVSNRYVGNLRQESLTMNVHSQTGESDPSGPISEKRTGRDGRTIDTSKIGKRAPAELPPNVDPASYTMQSAANPAAPKEAPKDELDGIGQTIPEDLVAKYRSSATWANTWLHRFNEIVREVGTLYDKNDERLLALNRSIFDASVERIRFEIREKCRPHAVCRYCSGSGCRSCASRGWMSEREFATVPKELLRKGGAA